MIILKKILPVILVLALIGGTIPIAFAASSLSISSINYDSTVVKAESFTVSSSVTASNVAGTITVTVTLIDNTGGAVTITEAEKTLTFTTNATQNVQWSMTAGTAGTYSKPFTITATASDGGTATSTLGTPLTIQERPVLEVTFSGDKTSVSAGDSVRLDFTIMNSAAAGAADATNVIATLTPPNGWSRVTGPSPSTLGAIASGGGSKSGYWIVSADSPSSSNTLTITVTSTLPGGTITKTVAITGPTPTTPPAQPPVGGGTPATTETGKTPISTEPTGEVKTTVIATSADGKASVTIAAGTIAKDAAGNPLTEVSVTLPSALPAGVPSGVEYVGIAIQIGPEGATFSHPVEISITFDPADFEGKTPVIYVYEAGEWNALDTTVVGNKATAKVTHFSTFVLFAVPEVTPTPTPSATPTISPTTAPTPLTTPTPRPKWRIPGFEAIFALAGVLAVAYLLRKRK